MKKIFLYLTACELRLLDANKLCNYFTINGHEIVDKPEKSDLIIFIGCGIFNDTTNYSFKKLEKYKKYNKEIIIVGCLPAMEQERLKEIFDGKMVSTKELDKNPDIIDSLFPENKIKFRDVKDVNTFYAKVTYENLDETTSFGLIKRFLRRIPVIKHMFIKIETLIKKFDSDINKKPFRVRVSWGCKGNCSYCIIKKAIGKLHSKPISECVSEFKNGLEKGYKKFIITGDDTSVYGQDINSSLPELLDEITNIPGDYEITILNLNPLWVSKYIDDFEKILKKGKITCIEVPFQSGSNRILKLMHRYNDVENMKKIFKRLNSIPNVSIKTHAIIGFPTETWDDLKQTINFIKDVDVKEGMFFKYSCKTGTESEELNPKVPPVEIKKRAKYVKKKLKNFGYQVFHRTVNVYLFYKNKDMIK